MKNNSVYSWLTTCLQMWLWISSLLISGLSLEAQIPLTEIKSGRISLIGGTGASDIACGDLDMDGKRDMVVVFNASGNVNVLRNTSAVAGDPSFAVPLDIKTNAQSSLRACIADLNNDHFPEIIVTQKGIDGVTILLNKSTVGNIRFEVSAPILINNISGPFSVCDLDMNGLSDIVVSAGSDIKVLMNLSQGKGLGVSFSDAISFSPGQQVRELKCADFDGDGMADIVTTGAKGITILKNNSVNATVAFSTPIIFATEHPVYNMEIGDIDGDFKADIVTVNWPDNNFSVIRNTTSAGTFTFDNPIDFESAAFTTVALGDFNMDGKLDVLTMLPKSDGDLAEIYYNNTDESTRLQFSGGYMFNLASERLMVNDIDGDGADDFAGVSSASDNISVFIHDATNQSQKLSQLETYCGEDGLPWLSWHQAQEATGLKYVIERTTDGRNFSSIGSINGTEGMNGDYNFSDTHPLSGNMFYRIKTTDSKAEIRYSQLVAFEPCEEVLTDFICVFPNPVDKMMNFQFSLTKQMEMQYEIYNMQLMVTVNKSEIVSPGTRTYSLDVSALEAGSYLMSVRFGNLPAKVCRFEKL